MCPCFMLQENLVGFVHDASLLYVAKKTCFNFPCFTCKHILVVLPYLGMVLLTLNLCSSPFLECEH